MWGEGGRKLDNWGEHAVTCQRYHIENMSFVRSGWKLLTLSSTFVCACFIFLRLPVCKCLCGCVFLCMIAQWLLSNCLCFFHFTVNFNCPMPPTLGLPQGLSTHLRTHFLWVRRWVQQTRTSVFLFVAYAFACSIQTLTCYIFLAKLVVWLGMMYIMHLQNVLCIKIWQKFWLFYDILPSEVQVRSSFCLNCVCMCVSFACTVCAFACDSALLFIFV